ncbi:MAG TPA: TIM barrel protein [Thermomicrobiales bacterium]|nr:TIM barrel protein [Thermomicrobiales bacterium]
MPKLAANITMLFTEYPLADRFERAAANGFGGVEMLFPYEMRANEVQDLLREHHLDLVLFNLPAGDWAAGDRGIAADTNRVDEFRNGVDKAVTYAEALKPRRVNCLVGKADDVSATRSVMLENIVYAADALATVNTRLVIEPVNTQDVEGFAIPDTAAARSVLAEIEHPNVGLQFDVYHSLRMGEDPLAIIRELGASLDHIQIADVPGRHQPGTGELDFEQVFATIDSSGYTGWVSLEYNPAGHTEEGFGHLRELGYLDTSASRQDR